MKKEIKEKFIMTEEAKNARRAYMRNWKRANKDKLKAYEEKYWSKKAEQKSQEETIKEEQK